MTMTSEIRVVRQDKGFKAGVRADGVDERNRQIPEIVSDDLKMFKRRGRSEEERELIE